MSQFNFNLLPAIPADIFLNDELRTLEEASREYHQRTTDLPEAIRKKELSG